MTVKEFIDNISVEELGEMFKTSQDNNKDGAENTERLDKIREVLLSNSDTASIINTEAGMIMSFMASLGAELIASMAIALSDVLPTVWYEELFYSFIPNKEVPFFGGSGVINLAQIASAFELTENRDGEMNHTEVIAAVFVLLFIYNEDNGGDECAKALLYNMPSQFFEKVLAEYKEAITLYED